MDTPMTEKDVKALERVFPTLTMPYATFEAMRDIFARARALLAQRDALKAELVCAHEAMETERARADSYSLDLAATHTRIQELEGKMSSQTRILNEAMEARNRELNKANEELTECRHALGGFAGPTYGISEEVKKVVAELEGCRKDMRDVKLLLLPESEGSRVPHPVIVARVNHLLAVDAAATEADHTIARLSREVGTERAERQKAHARLDGVNAALREFGYDDWPVKISERIRQMGAALVEARGQVADLRIITAERDTLAARVKELEGAKNEFGFNPRMMEMVTVMTSMAEELEKTSAELAAVKAERDGIIAQAKETYTNFGFLCDIRDVLKTTKYGTDLVAAIKAMKEELETLRALASKNAGSIAALYEANQRMGRELEQAKKGADPDPIPVGHMIRIPAEYCGDSSKMHAYADGYLAGKGAK